MHEQEPDFSELYPANECWGRVGKTFRQTDRSGKIHEISVISTIDVVLLSLNIDPFLIEEGMDYTTGWDLHEDPTMFDINEPAAPSHFHVGQHHTEYLARREQLKSAILAGALHLSTTYLQQQRIEVADFLAWVQQAGWSLPDWWTGGGAPGRPEGQHPSTLHRRQIIHQMAVEIRCESPGLNKGEIAERVRTRLQQLTPPVIRSVSHIRNIITQMSSDLPTAASPAGDALPSSLPTDE